MKTLYFLILSTFLCLSMSCSGLFDLDDDQTPQDDCDIDPVTLTDDMRFGCKINGVPWKNKALNPLDEILGQESLIVRYEPTNNGLFYIASSRKIETPCDTISKLMVLDISSPILGINPLAFDNDIILNFATGHRYYIDTLNERYINFSLFNEEDKTASGTFKFTAINEDDISDTLKITEGRFNVDWPF